MNTQRQIPAPALVDEIKKMLVLDCGYHELNESLSQGECFRLEQKLPEMPVCTLSLMAPDPSKPRFYLRATRRMEETGYSESYEIYDIGSFNSRLFQPSFWAFSRLSEQEIKRIVDRVADAMTRTYAFFRSGDDGLRPYERKTIKVICE